LIEITTPHAPNRLRTLGVAEPRERGQQGRAAEGPFTPSELPRPQLQQRHDVGGRHERVGDHGPIAERDGGDDPLAPLADEQRPERHARAVEIGDVNEDGAIAGRRDAHGNRRLDLGWRSRSQIGEERAETFGPPVRGLCAKADYG
jgi:hypothetical protein